MIRYDLNYRQRFTLHARNIVSGDRRDVTVYAHDATGAYALGFDQLDREASDRSWCFDSYTKEN